MGISYNKCFKICWYRCWKIIAILLVWLVYIEITSQPTDERGEWEITQEKFEALMLEHQIFLRDIALRPSELRDRGNEESGPPQSYEMLRHRVYNNVKELWYFLKYTLILMQQRGYAPNKVQDILVETERRKRTLLSLLETMSHVDGYEEWRRRTAADTSDLVQKRLYHLQNPKNCTAARKLVCSMKKECGFGCRIHHLVYCMIFAYATERTLILDYSGKNPKQIFHISDSCIVLNSNSILKGHQEYIKERDDEKQEIAIPCIDFLHYKSDYGFLPLSVPQDLAPRVVMFNGDPASWWVGQIVKFLLKPCPDLQRSIDDIIDKLDFKNPIVGIHVRRTDKVDSEAAYHNIHEYMEPVRQYFNQLELSQPVPQRRVYLATDDITVLAEARRLYPNYTFISDPTIARKAARNRQSHSALAGLLADVTMLSRTDYLVCTFSSQVGRLAYELMQSNRMDASTSFTSLDDIYYFGGQSGHNRYAVMPNKPSDVFKAISFEVGDILGVAGNLWNGYGEGDNKRNGEKGLIPWFKTSDQLVTYPFPLYPKIGQAHRNSEESRSPTPSPTVDPKS